MKTAVSIPDALFKKADRVARRLSISRSRLYASAIEAFLEAHSDHEITTRLNQVYQGESSRLDPAMQEMQARTIERHSSNSW
jgi:metal-responsive CopG/Arc/MetJ family transcriptional regulator